MRPQQVISDKFGPGPRAKTSAISTARGSPAFGTTIEIAVETGGSPASGPKRPAGNRRFCFYRQATFHVAGHGHLPRPAIRHSTTVSPGFDFPLARSGLPKRYYSLRSRSFFPSQRQGRQFSDTGPKSNILQPVSSIRSNSGQAFR